MEAEVQAEVEVQAEAAEEAEEAARPWPSRTAGGAHVHERLTAIAFRVLLYVICIVRASTVRAVPPLRRYSRLHPQATTSSITPTWRGCQCETYSYYGGTDGILLDEFAEHRVRCQRPTLELALSGVGI